MSSMTQNDLRTSLRDWADEAPAGGPPIDELITRGSRRRRRRHAAGVAVAGLVAVAVGAAVVGVNAGTGPGPAASPASAAAPAPTLALAAAVKSTASGSFRYTSDLTQTVPAEGVSHVKTRCTGVIDPATQTGYSKYGLTEHWVINGVRYLKEGNHRYVIGKGDAGEFLTCGGTGAGRGLLSADPLTLLNDLKTVSSVRQSGAAGDATYAFRSPGLTGTVTLAGARVSSMTLHIDSPKTTDTPAYRRDVTMTLSGYGVPVALKAPW
jgi:hypothetical protein